MEGGIDEKYRNSVIEELSKNIIDLEDNYLKTITDEEIEDNISNYAEALGYEEKDGKYYDGEEQVKIEKDLVKEWLAQEKAIKKAKKEYLSYSKEIVEKSDKVWEAANKLTKINSDGSSIWMNLK